ncbi:hypothetical protein Dfer_0705 [Dyadobacter fermentans DSM 18053]|uniref:Uncharacterized protein n=1 Tax=Dyadobacter fermentans (strain ATCC 700827 / DSM 18053 / CIP 107007 / KCTC 52180 / NS114) TaxID=471854 RepID=C6W1B0_DYAFD|nr:hypothetical protein Dfer_0705 [Dyadobacter fermentans DSM 18053]
MKRKTSSRSRSRQVRSQITWYESDKSALLKNFPINPKLKNSVLTSIFARRGWFEGLGDVPVLFSAPIGVQFNGYHPSGSKIVLNGRLVR